MTTLVITLAWAGLLPGAWCMFVEVLPCSSTVPLAVLILGRDVALSLSAFYFRFISLPPPVSVVTHQAKSKRSRTAHGQPLFQPFYTFCRGQTDSDKQGESDATKATDGKINTALQLLLMGVTTVSPLVTLPIGGPLEALQWIVAGTTIWSGLSYVGKAGVRILPRRKPKV